MIKGFINGQPFGSEQGILTAILHYLVALGLNPVHHRNTGSIFGRNGDGSLRFGRSRSSINQRGAPDILVTYQGRGVAIEVKNLIGRLSADQIEWLEKFQCAPSHGLVVVARSVDDVVKAVEKINAGETWRTELQKKPPHPITR